MTWPFCQYQHFWPGDLDLWPRCCHWEASVFHKHILFEYRLSRSDYVSASSYQDLYCSHITFTKVCKKRLSNCVSSDKNEQIYRLIWTIQKWHLLARPFSFYIVLDYGTYNDHWTWWSVITIRFTNRYSGEAKYLNSAGLPKNIEGANTFILLYHGLIHVNTVILLM